MKRVGAARRLMIGAAAALSAVVVADLLLPPPLERAEDLSPLAVDRNGEWLHAFGTQDGRWRFRADLENIDPVFVERLIAVEDKRFYAHPGVDPLAVMRASFSSAKAGRIVSGASTITMQTARLLEPRPRTFRAKAMEMLRALQIERRLSKKEILELYLTLAPYGGNIEGVRAASLSWFGKEPVRLTDAEQALLIALPQAPEARRPDLKAENARDARRVMLNKLAAVGKMTPVRAEEAADVVLPKQRRGFPRFAYHAAQRLSSDKNIARTTIDAGLQARAESLVARHANELSDNATASLIIIDNKTLEVRAIVGSSALDAPGGWMDLTAAVRSPGSALKPFIYALAFDDGRLAPATIIDDMPRAFGDYTPENFDRVFRGEVRAREALQHSLNLPAVAALGAVGTGRFLAAVDAAGVELKTRRRPGKEPGLALALGGAGVTAQDLGVLYAGLANDGVMRPLVWMTEEQDEQIAYRLFSENAARRISAILADAPALAGRAPAALSKKAARVAFKTGTSYGYRDAWAAGHNGDYTVVAWVGHADGAPRPGETGRKAAAPLLFDAFDLIAETTGAGARDLDDDFDDAAPAIARLDAPSRQAPPEIVFPRDGVEIYLGEETRGFALAARGGAGDLSWYVDGAAVAEVDARTLWRPGAPGFYNVIVVDREGRSASAKVRVHSAFSAPA